MVLDGVVRARVHAHVNQGKTGPLAIVLNGNNVLVALGSHLQLHLVSAAVIPTRDGPGHFILAVVVYVASIPTAMALDGLAIFLQLFVVVGDDFVGSVVGEELRGVDLDGRRR